MYRPFYTKSDKTLVYELTHTKLKLKIPILVVFCVFEKASTEQTIGKVKKGTSNESALNSRDILRFDRTSNGCRVLEY